MGGRVQDQPGTDPLEEATDPDGVPDVAQHHGVVVEQPVAGEFELQGVQGRLVVVEQEQPVGTEPADLAGQLAADRATGSSDQDGVAANDVAAVLAYFELITLAEQAGHHVGLGPGAD